jgi:tRNA G37 N-methylase Trm5
VRAAAEYLKQNIELNDVDDTVEGHEGDVREVVPELDEKFDRIIMPLPERAGEFLNVARKVYNGIGDIHLYSFDEYILDSMPESLEVSNIEVCGQRGPNSVRICAEIN